ncbi:MAG: hypothetical protein QOC87_978 [Actinomycetota bacterium]|nr:hypothetical protein [Actinomycetota bacterium]
MERSSTFGPFFIAAGVMHFVAPAWYEAIIPPSMPSPRALVYASGVAEILSGVGVLIPSTRRRASALAVATLIAVYPANLYMAARADKFERKVPGGRWALYARLPLQGALIAWARAAGKS